MRPGTPDDGAALLMLHQVSIEKLGRGFYTPAELESRATGLRPEGYGEAMANGETFVMAWTPDGDLAGFASFKSDAVIGFYVHPDWSRCGLGRELLRRAEDRIVDDGHQTIRIEASLSGVPFYIAQGYRVVCRRTADTRGGLVIEVADLKKDV